MDPSYSHFEQSQLGEQEYAENETTYFQDDGIWLISCSFSIWTMVSGFGLLESGRVSSKDEVNIMVKNVVDVVFGGLSYWMFGFGFTYGKYQPNPFIGLGNFFYDPDRDGLPSDQAWHYARFFFQMSFATTTSTIVSAAMAERIRLKPYIVITYLMTLVHSITAHWVWSEDGFLYQLGVVDAAGCSVVHLVGGVAGLASTLYLKPRQARFGERGSAHMSNPTNALLGTFMLWWGWLAFNTGTTMGVANGRWRLASRSAMVTLLSSIGGGCTSIVISLISTRKCQIDLLIDGLLASLVATTAGCHSIRPFDSVAIGAIGAALALSVYPLVERLEIDDPVGIIPVHVVGATWGMLSVGIFSKEDGEIQRHDQARRGVTKNRNGLLQGGGIELLMVQALCVVCVFVFSMVITFISLVIMNQFPWGLRMTKYEEQLGADLIEHGLAGHNIAKYSIEKRLNVNVVKFVAKWKRLARKARERRLAELAAIRAQDPTTAASGTGAEGVDQIGVAPDHPSVGTNGSTAGTHLRLGPLKLGALRRPSHFLGGSTLSARPKSGRMQPIEQDKNSLPPMHSERMHPLEAKAKTWNTSLDLPDHAATKTNHAGEHHVPNGIIAENGSIPFGKPITVVTPSSPTPNALEQHGLGGMVEQQSGQTPAASQHQTAAGTQRRESRSIIGRFRRGARVSPRREEIPLQEHGTSAAAAITTSSAIGGTTDAQQQEHSPPQAAQMSPHSPRLPPLSSRSIVSARQHENESVEVVNNSTAGGGDNDDDNTKTTVRRRSGTSIEGKATTTTTSENGKEPPPKHINDSIV